MKVSLKFIFSLCLNSLNWNFIFGVSFDRSMVGGGYVVVVMWVDNFVGEEF